MSETSTPNQDSGAFMMLFSLMFLFLIMFNPGLRDLLGDIVNIFFFPVIGFKGEWPVLTLLLAGSIMTLISIILRHKYTDWLGMAKSQKIMKTLGEAMKEARQSGDYNRMEKLMVEQKKRGQEQMLQTSIQMRSTMSSFIFIIAIFAWVAVFISSLNNKTFSIPWATNVSLIRYGPFLKIVPIWIFIYSLVSIPLGQVIQKALKENTFKKRLDELENIPVPEDSPTADETVGTELIGDAEETSDDGVETEEDSEEDSDVLTDEEILTALEQSSKIVVPGSVNPEAFADIVITMDNKTDYTLENVVLDLSNLEECFEVAGNLHIASFRPGMELEERIRIKPKYQKGSFPVNLVLAAGGIKKEQNYTIKVGREADE